MYICSPELTPYCSPMRPGKFVLFLWMLAITCLIVRPAMSLVPSSISDERGVGSPGGTAAVPYGRASATGGSGAQADGVLSGTASETAASEARTVVGQCTPAIAPVPAPSMATPPATPVKKPANGGGHEPR